MFLPKIDWLVVWKIYHYPFFFWSYAALSLATRALMLRRVDPASPFKTWLLSSSASLLVVPAMPFLAVPAFMLVALVAGRVGVYSFFMAVPIAVSLGSAGALVDAILFRLLLRKTVGKKQCGFFSARTPSL